jgi:5-methylcytosine-specific restriction endonuclease McrA
MGEVRMFTRRQRWLESEVALLRAVYAETGRSALAALFPSRDLRSIECKANWLGLARPKRIGRSEDEVRAAKRAHMAARRAADPEAARAYQRANLAKNRAARNAYLRELSARRLFRSRSRKVRGVSPQELAALWKRQRGRCALTGRRLDRTAQLDHKLPKARGGTDDIWNLQWLCEDANLAKRAMTDAEFAALCGEVTAWIGARIDAALSAQARAA